MTNEEYTALKNINGRYLHSRWEMFRGVTSEEDFLHDIYLKEGSITEESYIEHYKKNIRYFLNKSRIERSIMAPADVGGGHSHLSYLRIYKYCYSCSDYFPEWEFHRDDKGYYTKHCKRCRKVTDASIKETHRMKLSDGYIRDILKKTAKYKGDIVEITPDMIVKKREQLLKKRNEKKKESSKGEG